MRYFFAFPASEQLSQGFHSVTAAFAQGLPKQPMAPEIVSLAQLYADEIVDALVLNLTTGHDASHDHDAPKALETVANVIKSTSHGLIRQVVAKMSNAELQPLVNYIQHHRQAFDCNGEVRDCISFEISEADHNKLSDVFGRAAETGENSAEVEQAMRLFVDLALQAFYSETAKVLKLGFIARNLFAMGEAAIHKGGHMAVGRLIPSMKPKALKVFANYFATMLRQAN